MTEPAVQPLYAIRELRWQLGPGFSMEIDALDLPRGRTTLLLGPSASGKSTLLSLLGRVEGAYFPGATPPSLSGEITLAAGDGHEAVELLALSERELLRRRVRGPLLGIVFQQEGLFPGKSAVENIAWPLVALGSAPEAARERALALLDRVALAPDRQVATLSGGERKRLALARALGPDPPVLLLDEPLTGLDPAALGELLDLLAGLAAEPERSVVMVSHQREDIERLGEHVVLLRDGRVAAAGGRDALADELSAFLAGLAPAR